MDLKNSRILSMLDTNSRTSYSELGKNNHISKDSARYRITNLIEEQTIRGFRAAINVNKLGYLAYRILIKLHQNTPEDDKRLETFLTKNKHVGWSVSVEGEWDINTYLLFKETKEMLTFEELLKKEFSEIIQEIKFSIYAKLESYSRDYLTNSKKRKITTIYELSHHEKIDDSDIAIIKKLAVNARTSILELAKSANITPKTAISRLKILEKKKIITGYRLDLNLDNIERKYYKLHINLNNHAKKKEIQEFIKTKNYVIYYDLMIGGYDLEYELECSDDKELREFLDELRANFGTEIKDYQILTYYKKQKEIFFPEI